MIKFKTRLHKRAIKEIIKNTIVCIILSISMSYGQNNRINHIIVDFLPQNQNTSPSYNILPQVIPSNQKLSPPLFEELKDPITKKEFLISYKLYVENGVAQGEKYNISEPIKKRTKNNDYEFDYTCKIDTHTTDHTDGDATDYELKAILNYQKEAVLECLYKSGVKITDNSLTHNAQSHTKTLLTLQAKAVEVYLDNNFLVLEVWKEKK